MTVRRLELADVIRTHERDVLARWNHVLSREQTKALRNLRDCRTAALGGHLQQCDRCGHRVILYNSCRNRHCNKCQAMARARWLALQNPKQIYAILFRAASETLLTIAADPRHLGASIGFLAVLHTWGQNLHLHPHLHCVVPGGGISFDGSRWIACRQRFFLPVGVLSRLFRKKFLKSLRAAFRNGALHLSGELESLTEPAAFQALCHLAARIEWVVYAKPPFGGPERVLKYLARYTHRVAISNHRLQSLKDGRLSFAAKDYADHGRTKTMTLDAVEFIRRFLLHVLPSGFVRIRQFGFLANRVRKQKLALCRALLASRQPALIDSPVRADAHGEDHTLCPICKLGRLIVVELLSVPPIAVYDTS
jgi:Putative transposase/Transposase zinc-binding domain